ncbi:hypothetical protein C0L85_05430 [Clostridium perfringens]|uniref:hypothetical protein n=2 Tax=Clostridium perfringens TaxID=1502 RepID=UPI001CABE909|nr:hypothetical protein [Clostridium perfringens]QTZ82826.1 hypothetical protein phiCpA_00054 [Clostridium phage phiCp-A]MDK0718747.1 hypothetical protein [Clostridium perfringens]MDM0462629.1 hypothetical protein [Clostridium perfringens]MDO6336732.1 hypothetical protein [Clostridium perfringens]MDU1597929.1 hypothetical protein [Clostridium perfringens]
MKQKLNLIKCFQYYFDDILNNIEHKKYYYTDCESYMKLYVNDMNSRDMSTSMQIYWKEILLRVHFTATTSIIRNQRWLSGVISGIENKNFMIFSSALRGFLESVTDSFYSLEEFTTALPLNYKNINKAVRGELNELMSTEKLENDLLHFQMAKKSKENMFILKALPATKYIEYFDKFNSTKTKELYSQLCEITHPASRSITCFTEEIVVSDSYSYLQTTLINDSNQIEKIFDDYLSSIESLLKISLTIPFLILKILLKYDFDEVKSEYIERCAANELLRESFEKVLKLFNT